MIDAINLILTNFLYLVNYTKMPKYLDSKDALLLHKRTIQNKKWLNLVYKDFYTALRKLAKKRGTLVELGSGGGFIKEFIPKIITSDVIAGPGIDLVFSAQKMPFKSRSVSTFILLNTFHHLKRPQESLREMRRCLKIGGKIVMIEPFNSFLSRFVYKSFHYEPFDIDADWEIPGKGRITDSNNALAWIVFIRDRNKFNRLFPNLKINLLNPHTPFKYLISGGLTKPQILPSFLYPLVFKVEKKIEKINKHLGMFITIEITKIK